MYETLNEVIHESHSTIAKKKDVGKIERENNKPTICIANQSICSSWKELMAWRQDSRSEAFFIFLQSSIRCLREELHNTVRTAKDRPPSWQNSLNDKSKQQKIIQLKWVVVLGARCPPKIQWTATGDKNKQSERSSVRQLVRKKNLPWQADTTEKRKELREKLQMADGF